MSIRALIAMVVGATALVVALPAVACAQTLPSAAEYDLSFTLPTAGMSGCTVCHGDPNLVRATAVSTETLYVDEALLAESAHGSTLCTGCHVDFAFKTPHDALTADEQWRDVAKSACKGCHDPAFTEMSSGAHSYAGTPGEDASATAAARVAAGKPEHTPLCGDCHGSHSIPTTSTAEYDAWQLTGIDMCGECHDEAYSYEDYWHGEAYRNGAPDAPTCWDCHGAHLVLPSDNRQSPTNENNLVKTCSQCHPGADEEYVEYAALIHSRMDAYSQIPFYDTFKSAQATVQGWFDR